MVDRDPEFSNGSRMKLTRLVNEDTMFLDDLDDVEKESDSFLPEK